MIVEDDKSIREELKELLKNAGYESVCLEDFENAETQILNSNSDLILLDINLPFMNGQTILQNLRQKKDIPVIMVTSKTTEIDEVLSMSYGADDFITKPYNPTILLLRIGAIFKRMEHQGDIACYKDLTIYRSKGIIKKEDTEIILTKNEMIILNYLLNNQNRIVSRDELMTDLWNNNEYINDNALTVNISRLRSKLKSIGHEDAIETRKGIGYILT